jgi:predicted esterase
VTSTSVAPHAHHLRVQRTARYYTLGGAGGSPRDIWFVLHGYGQLAGEFIRFFSDLASDDELVAAPEAMNRFYLVSVGRNPARDRPVGATWMTREDRECEIADYVEYLDALYDEVAAAHVARGARVHVLGFSQAVATAARWIEHGRATVHRFIAWGGILPPETTLAAEAPALRGVPVVLVAGRRDQYVTPEILDAERARLDAASIAYQVFTFDGGHVVSRSVFPQLRERDPQSTADASDDGQTP